MWQWLTPYRDTRVANETMKLTAAILVISAITCSQGKPDIQPESISSESLKFKPHKNESSEIAPRFFDDWFFDSDEDDRSKKKKITIHLETVKPSEDVTTAPTPVTCPTSPKPPPCPPLYKCPPPVTCPPAPPPITCPAPVTCAPVPPPVPCPGPPPCYRKTCTIVSADPKTVTGAHKVCFNFDNILVGDGGCLFIKAVKAGIKMVVVLEEEIIHEQIIKDGKGVPDHIKVPQLAAILKGFYIQLKVQKRTKRTFKGCTTLHFDGLPPDGISASCFTIRRPRQKCSCEHP